MAPSRSLSLSSNFLSSFKIASLSGLISVLGFSIALYAIYSLILAIYQIYFSPLRKIPGPKLWIFFPILRHISGVRGTIDINCRRFFNYYRSDAIRIGPDEVIFNSAPAWQDIYGHGHTPQMPKPFRRIPGETHNILNASDADHTRFRRALAHAFSEKALREQEFLLQRYNGLLIERLGELAEQGKPANMTTWYNYITFDIIGDLSFGQPFGCLVTSSYHWWVSNVSNNLKYLMILRLGYVYPLFSRIWKLFQSKERLTARAKTFALSRARVTQRLNNESQVGRKDFIDFLQHHKGESDEITEEEMVANMVVLIIAGSETTASLLTGLTYWLLRTPDVLRRITDEIRSTFKSEDEITVQAVTNKLPYTLACLQEALRIYPPVPGTLGRTTLQDEVIAGYPIPKGTHVGLHHTGAYWSESNFHRATEFLPERWLPEALEDPTNEFYHDNRRVHEPFHTGPRNCIGRNLAMAEMRLIITHVLYNFDLEFDPSMLAPRADLGGRNLVDTWLWEQKTTIVWTKPDLDVVLKRRPQGQQQQHQQQSEKVG